MLMSEIPQRRNAIRQGRERVVGDVDEVLALASGPCHGPDRSRTDGTTTRTRPGHCTSSGGVDAQRLTQGRVPRCEPQDRARRRAVAVEEVRRRAGQSRRCSRGRGRRRQPSTSSTTDRRAAHVVPGSQPRSRRWIRRRRSFRSSKIARPPASSSPNSSGHCSTARPSMTRTPARTWSRSDGGELMNRLAQPIPSPARPATAGRRRRTATGRRGRIRRFPPRVRSAPRRSCSTSPPTSR